MRIWLLILLLAHSLYSFYDQELMDLWSSIEDMTNPTIEEYKRIDNYLQNGDRPYLKPITDQARLDRIRSLQLIGSSDELPIFEKHSLNVNERTKNRCIVLFGSYNNIYPSKARTLLSELKKCGYSGHVLLRIGGFPNLEDGGLKVCHVPYSFKVAALLEAKRLGYREILWLDIALHPLTDLESIFTAIQKRGFFFTSVGSLSDNGSTHLPEAAATLGITPSQYPYIPHISSCMLGLNTKDAKAVQLLQDWFVEVERVTPCATCWPEELSLSVIAWRLGCKPYSWLGYAVCNESEIGIPAVMQRPLQFYLDSVR